MSLDFDVGFNATEYVDTPEVYSNFEPKQKTKREIRFEQYRLTRNKAFVKDMHNTIFRRYGMDADDVQYATKEVTLDVQLDTAVNCVEDCLDYAQFHVGFSTEEKELLVSLFENLTFAKCTNPALVTRDDPIAADWPGYRFGHVPDFFNVMLAHVGACSVGPTIYKPRIVDKLGQPFRPRMDIEFWRDANIIMKKYSRVASVSPFSYDPGDTDLLCHSDGRTVWSRYPINNPVLAQIGVNVVTPGFQLHLEEAPFQVTTTTDVASMLCETMEFTTILM